MELQNGAHPYHECLLIQGFSHLTNGVYFRSTWTVPGVVQIRLGIRYGTSSPGVQVYYLCP
jgi:hypothetical protein